MRLLVVAVGTRLPDWMNTGFAEYAKRMPRELPLELSEIKPEPRSSGKPVAALLATEAKRIEAALPSRCRRIALDERRAHALDMRAAMFDNNGFQKYMAQLAPKA